MEKTGLSFSLQTHSRSETHGSRRGRRGEGDGPVENGVEHEQRDLKGFHPAGEKSRMERRQSPGAPQGRGFHIPAPPRSTLSRANHFSL